MKMKWLNISLGGMCVLLLTGCGNQTTEFPDKATAVPSVEPTIIPSVAPTMEPTTFPTAEPTIEPTSEPMAETETPTDFYKVATNKTAQEVEEFAELVRETLLAGDFEKMSELVAYPITIDGERIESAEEFRKMDYGSKVNPKFLEKAEAASCEQMFCNRQGIMMGDTGSVWFAEVLYMEVSELRVTALNNLVDPAFGISAEEIAKTREAYKQVLLTVMNELKLPDGTELYFDGIGEFSRNRFAIHDVDEDGREELILSYVTGPMAVQGKYVFGYNPEADMVCEQGRAFDMVFYDNGVIKSEASHNHGRGEKLWPYTVYYYSSPTDDYRYGAHVDSWEKAYYGDIVNGYHFPSFLDNDKDGVMYYLMPYDDYSYDNDDALDGKAYQEWYERQFGRAEIIEPTYHAMTKENIEGAGNISGEIVN